MPLPGNECGRDWTGCTTEWRPLRSEGKPSNLTCSSRAPDCRHGTPLADLLAELGPEASKAVRDVLITGLALGEGPRRIGARMRSAFAGNLYRAQSVARTEILRAYREAALR